MPAQSSFDYAVIRVVPRVERGEFINAGVILFCRTRQFLAAKISLNQARLAAIAPQANAAHIEAHLALFPTLCAGGPSAGPIGQLSQAERFHWLVAPRSTVVQTAPVHCGLCTNPAAALDELMDALVR